MKVTPTPKNRIIADKPLADFVRGVTADPRFITAAEASLLQFIEGTPTVTDASMALAGYNQIQGAKMLLKHLYSIADPTPPAPTISTPGNLNHRV